jgi:L,D-peptidoglycan transpeptidase YkuD (ErfK/YbiS/YcfS/YnhG family)
MTDLIVTAPDTCRANGRALRCAVGKGGFTTDKREGDGATPVGAWTMRRVLYRPDRLDAAPDTALETAAIAPGDGWCDDPGHPLYNRPVALPFEAGHEAMWRDDGLYDVVVVLGHNDDPPVPGMGSAIFLHCARPDFGPTLGCVAVARDDLLAVLKGCGADSRVVVQPAAE